MRFVNNEMAFYRTNKKDDSVSNEEGRFIISKLKSSKKFPSRDNDKS